MEYLELVCDKVITAENLHLMSKFTNKGEYVLENWLDGCQTDIYISPDLVLQCDMSYDGSSYDYIFIIIFNGAVLKFGSIDIICDDEYEGYFYCWKNIDTKSLIDEMIQSNESLYMLVGKYTRDLPMSHNITTFKELFTTVPVKSARFVM